MRTKISIYLFCSSKNKRFTITNYEDLKSGKISTVQIDGKDRSVSFLTTASERLTLKEMRYRA